MNVDSIKIEHDEDGFHLILDGDDFIFTFRFRITDPEALYDTVKREIGPWLYERDMAKREYDGTEGQDRKSYSDDQDRDSYEVSDPKHPEFHSTHADIWDSREGK